MIGTLRGFVLALIVVTLSSACGGQPKQTESPAAIVEPVPTVQTATPGPTDTQLPTTAASPSPTGVAVTPTTPSSAPSPTDTEVASNTPTLVPSPTETEVKPSPTPLVMPTTEAEPVLQEYPVPPGSRPHDVAPAPDGSVWYTAQRLGELGRLDPASGETHHIELGEGSAPHGVIVGPDGAPWITDGGLNAIVRVDPVTEEVQRFPLPAGSGYTNLNTATFDQTGVLWFTGQSGIYGRLNRTTGQMEVFDAPRGRGPYGIATTPNGSVYYASLAGSYIARVDLETGTPMVLEPPTPGQGARRVWSDTQGRVWVSEWNAGQLAMYEPATGEWREWRLPGDQPQPYAVYVDDQEMVWLSDFRANALVRFDPAQDVFETFFLPSAPANVRQLLGRPGEVWGAESGVDKLVVVRTN
jgi:virginiamycin B lyase